MKLCLNSLKLAYHYLKFYQRKFWILLFCSTITILLPVSLSNEQKIAYINNEMSRLQCKILDDERRKYAINKHVFMMKSFDTEENKDNY